jgi:hypothetical protein
MAFNETDNQDIIQSGFITSSKGTDGNRAYGQLFEGMANTLNNGLQAFDVQTRTSIEMDASKEVNSIAEGGLPPSLQKELGIVSRYKSAKDQGSMPNLEFDTKMAQLSKSLKTKYPVGYHSMIDDQIASAAGTNSANRARQEALAAEQAAMEGSSKAEKARTDFMDKEENRKVLSSQQGRDLYKDMTGKDFDPQTASIEEMRAVVMVKTGQEATHAFNMEASKRKKDDAKLAAGALIQSTLQQQMSEANPIFRKFRTQLEQAGADGQIDDNERMAMRAAWMDFKAGFRVERDKFLYQSGHEGISQLTDQDLKELQAGSETALAGYESIFESPTAQNLKMLEDNNRLLFESSKSAFLTNPEYKTMGSYLRLKGMGFDPLTLDELMKNSGKQGEKSPYDLMEEEIGKAITLGVASGKFSLMDGFKMAGADVSPTSKKAIIQNWGNLLAKPDVPANDKVMLAEAVFADGNKDLLDQYAKNDPMQLFRLLVNPEVTTAMLSNEQAKVQYMEWANAQSLSFARRLGKQLEDSQISAEMGVLKFDGTRFSIDENILGSIVPKLGSLTGIGNAVATTGWEVSKLRDMRKQVEQMNAYIGQMEPIWKEMGWETQEGLLNAINSDPTKARKEGNWFTQMNQTIIQGGEDANDLGGSAGADDLSSNSSSAQLTTGIRGAAEALGIDPIDLATAISYETAGTFNPTKRGPRTQWGQHRGLIQWGEPQAEKYGVNWDDPVNSQLGSEGAIVKYLKEAGVKPGMGLMDIYSAINAGRVGRYNASDANNGGAPGNVRDKVNYQMSGHRKKAEKLFGV